MIIFIRALFFSLLCSSLYACNAETEVPNKNLVQFKAFSNNPEITGSILIYNLNQNSFYSNDFKWAKTGRIPASTYKIPHSLIALELGLADENTVFKWNGEQRMFKIWQQDLTFKQAFHYSCVPCFQNMARKIGETRMQNFIRKFNYGQMNIQANNIDNFWLTGHSKINQFDQIDFLKRLYLSQLPISKTNEKIFKKLFVVKQSDEFTLRAKTGLANNKGHHIGWYVGYIVTKKNTFFFATAISPQINYDKSFNNKRKDITMRALQQLGIIP